MDIVIPDDQRPTGRLVASCFDPTGPSCSQWHNPGFPKSRPRTSGVIDGGGSW